MSDQKIITELTPEQEALIPVYRERWRKIEFSTERIDRNKATEAVREAYNLISLPQPEIIFYDSPYAALKELDELDYIPFNSEDVFYCLHKLVFKDFGRYRIDRQIKRKLEWWLDFEQLERQANFRAILTALEEKLIQGQIFAYKTLIYCAFQADSFALDCCRFEFFCAFASKINFTYNREAWSIWRSIITNCSWIFDYENICLICDRPIKLSFDNQNRLHAEAEPAIEYADGFKVYAYHGVYIPEKYGRLYPNQWDAKWLLEEDNAELRRILIQETGYDFCS